MTTAPTGTEPGLKAYYPLDDGNRPDGAGHHAQPQRRHAGGARRRSAHLGHQRRGHRPRRRRDHAAIPHHRARDRTTSRIHRSSSPPRPAESRAGWAAAHPTRPTASTSSPVPASRQRRGSGRGLPRIARGDDRRQRPGFLRRPLHPAGRQTRGHRHRHRPPGRYLRSLSPTAGGLAGARAERPAGPRSAGDLFVRGRRCHHPARPRCRATRSGLGSDAVGHDRDAPAVGDCGPDRLGQWHGIADLQGDALGPQRGAGWPDLHGGGGCSCQQHAHRDRRVRGRLRGSVARGRQGRDLLGHQHGRHRPRLAPPGDPRLQPHAGGQEHHRRSPSRAGACTRSPRSPPCRRSPSRC